MKTIEKLQLIAMELKEMAIEREQEVEMAILAILSRSHMLMLGAPGIAKSMLIRALCERIEGGNYFEVLLTKETTSKELFVAQTNIEESQTPSGGKSIRFIPDVTGMLPETHIGFLDETFKANSATLNALLTLINERKFHIQGRPVDCPLVSLFGASNELPEEEDGLGALYDRFLIRIVSQRVKAHENRIEMRQKSRARRGKKSGNGSPTTITLTELAELQQQVLQVEVPVSIDEVVEDLVGALLTEGIIVSDRRDVRVDPLLQAKAFLEGRNVVNTTDLVILRHCFWADPKDAKTVERTILSVSNPLENEANEFLEQAEEIRANALKTTGNDAGAAGAEANTKLKKLATELESLANSAKAQGVDTTKIVNAVKQVRTFNKEVVKHCLGIDI